MNFLIYAIEQNQQSLTPFDQIKKAGGSAIRDGLCAGIAMTPFFYGFSKKSALQTNHTFQLTYGQSLKQYPKVFPILATVAACTSLNFKIFF